MLHRNSGGHNSPGSSSKLGASSTRGKYIHEVMAMHEEVLRALLHLKFTFCHPDYVNVRLNLDPALPKRGVPPDLRTMTFSLDDRDRVVLPREVLQAWLPEGGPLAKLLWNHHLLGREATPALVDQLHEKLKNNLRCRPEGVSTAALARHLVEIPAP